MEKITLISNAGAIISFDNNGGSFIKDNGLPANYETYDGSNVITNGLYYLLEFNGSDAAINPYTTQGYQQHGTTLQNVFLGERTITAKVLVAAGAYGYFENTARFFYDVRKQIFDVFNPVAGAFELDYTNNNGSKKINVILKNAPKELENYGTGRIYEFTFTACDPFWTDVSEQIVTLQRSTGGLTFGFILGTATDAHFGDLLNSQTISYKGQAPAGVTIEVTATSNCTNPKLTCVNTDGTQSIGINSTIYNGQVFTITTHYGNKKVTNNGINAMRYLMSGSKFFNLEPGINVLSMTQTSGSATIKVKYYNNYVNP